MHRIIYLIICSIISIFIQNCNKMKSKSIDEIKNINMEKVNNKIITFDEKPIYGINFSNINSTCQFELLVNDIPIFKFFNQKGGTNMFIPINTEILRSGTQKLKIKLYPSVVKDKLVVYDKEKTPFELSISVGLTGEDGILKDEKPLYTLPFIPLPEEGLPYWETDIEFEAEVPYDFEGWSKSKDLTKVEDIELKVFSKFKQFQEILRNQNTQELLRVSEVKNIEIYTSLYLSPDRIKEREDFMKIEEEEEVVPIEGSALKYYGDGKLVTLEDPSDGKSALRTIIIDKSGNGNDETITYPMYLHIPQGSDELEIIR